MKTKLLIAFAFISLISSGQNNMEEKQVTAPVTTTEASPQQDIYTMVDYMPSFPGGQAELTKFIQKNLKYPESAKTKGTGGKSYLKFIINADGTISDIQVLKGASGCPECDEEAIRVVKMMPKWIPGKQAGKNVPVYWNLPFNFQMN